jgi:2-iminobutanoate/2-iminopropanoate deaminase
MHYRPPGRSARRIVPQQLKRLWKVADGFVRIGRARGARRFRSAPLPRDATGGTAVMSELIAPPYAPPAAGLYSPGLLTGNWIYLSGQGGFDPDTGELVSDDIADQTAQAFRNVEVLLRAAGASLDDIVSCLVHLSDLAHFAEFNASYAKQFPSAVQPVRTTVGGNLAAGMRVEVTVIARRPAGAPGAVTPASR